MLQNCKQREGPASEQRVRAPGARIDPVDADRVLAGGPVQRDLGVEPVVAAGAWVGPGDVEALVVCRVQDVARAVDVGVHRADLGRCVRVQYPAADGDRGTEDDRLVERADRWPRGGLGLGEATAPEQRGGRNGDADDESSWSYEHCCYLRGSLLVRLCGGAVVVQGAHLMVSANGGRLR